MVPSHTQFHDCTECLSDLLAFGGFGPNARYPWETYEQYKARRKAQQKVQKLYLKGKLIHVSSALVAMVNKYNQVQKYVKIPVEGTYRKPQEV